MMRSLVALMLLISGLTLVCGVEPAMAAEDVLPWYSQEADPVVDSPEVAASGTVVAAALETAGYRAQQMVIQDLGEMLGWMAELIFIICMVGGLAAIALTNQYSTAIWMLIGPALFYFMVFNTTTSAGAQWQYGTFDSGLEGQVKVEETLAGGGMGMGGVMTSEVSWVFDEFNVFVSGVIQAMIKVVSNRNVKDQALFMVRQRVMSQVLETQVVSPGVTDFLRFNSWVCSEELQAARIIAKGKQDPDYRSTVEYRHAATIYYEEPFSVIKDAFTTIYEADGEPERRDDADVVAANAILTNKSPRYAINRHQIRHAGALGFLKEVYPLVRADALKAPAARGVAIIKAKNQANIDQAKSRLFLNHDCLKSESFQILEDKTSRNRMTYMSCEQMWCWMAAGVQLEQIKIMQESVDSVAKGKDYMTDIDHDNFLKQIYNDIAEKLTAPDKLQAVTNVGLLTQEGRSTEAAEEDYVGVKVEPDPSVIPIIIAGYMIKKAMQADVVSAMREQLTHHTGSTTSSQNFDLSRQKDETYTSASKREFYDEMLEYQYSAELQGKWFAVALLLPYLQGIMLYALALMYPFFCLMVLIPGRAGSFLGWMAFWVWVKSWDLGWAFVMIADTALWELLPHSGTFDPIRDPNNGPVTIFETAFEGDTAYSLSGYYMLLGLMINGVPMITGRFIIGAKLAMAGVLIDGFKLLGGKMGGQSADFLANEQTNRMEFVRYSNNYRHGVENMKKMGDFMSLDPSDKKGQDALRGQMQEFMGQAGRMDKQGDALDSLGKDFGSMGMVFMGLAGASGMMTTPAMIAGLANYKNNVSGALGGSKEYHRMANAIKAQYFQDNFQLQYFQFAQGGAAQDLVAIQGAVSKRGEYWNHPQFPKDALESLYQNLELSKQQEQESQGRITGDLIGGPSK